MDHGGRRGSKSNIQAEIETSKQASDQYDQVCFPTRPLQAASIPMHVITHTAHTDTHTHTHVHTESTSVSVSLPTESHHRQV
jgi:hypothetical protein